MREILFIAHRIPFPPDRGDKIRSHNVLRALAKLAPVHVATFSDDDDDARHEHELASLAVSYRLVRRKKPVSLAGLEALTLGEPVSLAAFRSPALAAAVREVLATRPIDAIYVFSGQMGQYVPASFKGRVIVDFVDVDSAKFAAYAETASWPMSWVHTREERLLRAEEARLHGRADASLLVSRNEATLFSHRLPGRTDKVHVLSNGMDSAGFDPVLVAPEPQLVALVGPRLIFTGQMDYAPNVAAALRAIERIMPLVRAELPEASLHVVGRNPVPELLRHDGQNGCRVWGRVDDIRPWLRGADIALVPLEIARGIQNKVLEAMAMELPVVLSPDAATGIDAVNGLNFSVAESDAELARAVISLWQDRVSREVMGHAARRFIVDRMSWQAALSRLPALLGMAPGKDAVRDAA